MTVRPLRDSDIPALRAMAEASGFPYPALNDPLIEAVLVVENDSGDPVMAVSAKRLVELYLYIGPSGHPAARFHALRLLHEKFPQFLRAKGYRSAEAFLPPAVARSFGKRLAKSFGWAQNLVSWTRTF